MYLIIANFLISVFADYYSYIFVLQLDFSKFDSEEGLGKVLESRIKSTLNFFEKECEFGSDLGPKFLAAKT